MDINPDVDRITATREDRFRALYQAHCRPLLGYALRRAATPADAADVVAETFLVAWRRLGDVPPGREARLWLFGVARGVVANQRRGDQRRHRLAERLGAELARQLPVAGPDGSGPLGDVGVAVTAALGRLDEGDRELLWLTAWEGLMPADLAAALAIPPPTARTRLHRARRRLRAELAAEGIAVGERSGDAGHVTDDGRPLVRDTKEEA